MGTAFLRQLQQEFKGYNGQKLAKDLMAGLTVAAVALPLALAFGVSAGATAACGLVTAIVAGLIISALTGGYYQISGPTGAMAAILGSLITTYGMQGMFVATFLAGALLILAAVLHLGNLTAFVPAPVIPRVLRSSSRWVRSTTSSARTRKGPVRLRRSSRIRISAFIRILLPR